MEPLSFLAQFWGAFMAIVGSIVLLGRANFVDTMVDVSKDRGFIIMAGFFALTIGIATVVLHNEWSMDMAGIVTLLGWLSIVGGVIRITMPSTIRSMVDQIATNSWVLYVVAILCIVLGASLLRFGLS